MSRIGRKIIKLPAGVKIAVEGGQVRVEGPKGKLAVPLPEGIGIDQADSTVTVKRAGDTKDLRAKHGLTRALLANAAGSRSSTSLESAIEPKFGVDTSTSRLDIRTRSSSRFRRACR
jgi:hypothetical protein